MEKKYTNGEITVIWKMKKCIHSGNCVKGLPSVFDVKASPWIAMDAASSEAIIQQVKACPSGAISIMPTEENNAKPATDVFVDRPSARMIPNGPLMVEGEIYVMDSDGKATLQTKNTAFCRCGASANKPFCDGSHRKIDFEA